MTLKLTSKISFMQNFFVVIFSKIDLFWIISASKFLRPSNKAQLMIVTGADTSHFASLLNLLNSIKKFEGDIKVAIWDLGLTKNEISKINSTYFNYEVKKFEFDKYPEHFNLKVNAGEYAWKPVIIYQEFMKHDGIVLWLDAGDLVTAKLNWIKRFTSISGFYSPYSDGTLIDWTHPMMLKRFKVTKRALHRRNLNGAIVSFSTTNSKAKILIKSWYECALSKDCIAPTGSGRENHRQDQSALTCLAYLYQIAPNGLYAVNRRFLGIKQHQDV